MNLFVRYLLPALSVVLLLVAVRFVASSAKEGAGPAKPPLAAPPANPFPDAVAGAGIIEAQTENISIGSPVSGVVVEVAVKVGQQVQPGDLLFRIDARDIQAQADLLAAAVKTQEAELTRLENLPRPEELPLKVAAVQSAQAKLEQARSNWQRIEKLMQGNATTTEQVDSAREQLRVTESDLAQAEADLTLLRAGAWLYERQKAEAAVHQAETDLDRLKVEIERRSIRALVAGEVLQVNVRPGEYVGTPPGQALIILGETHKLNVRVDIDEHDIPRFRPGMSGVAQVRGEPAEQFPLTFNRVEPFVIPKRSLTGDNTERIDTRVLQVIFEIGQHSMPLYVGQQVDVFIDTSTAPKSSQPITPPPAPDR